MEQVASTYDVLGPCVLNKKMRAGGRKEDGINQAKEARTGIVKLNDGFQASSRTRSFSGDENH